VNATDKAAVTAAIDRAIEALDQGFADFYSERPLVAYQLTVDSAGQALLESLS
jgi:ethanolamine utilization microcompartment shell protein EutL